MDETFPESSFRVSFCEYCVLGFLRGKEDSRKLTGQLVVVAKELLEVRQLSDTLWQLCRNELFSREILRSSGSAREILGNSLVSW